MVKFSHLLPFVAVTALMLVSSCAKGVSVKKDAVTGCVELCSGGLEGVTLKLYSDEHGTIYVESDASGNFTIEGVWPGTYRVIPEREGYTFAPRERIISMSGSGLTDQDFTAMLSWSRTYREGVKSKIYDIAQTVDCGYVMCGMIDRSGALGLPEAENMDFWVVKLDAYGNVEWEWIDGGNYIDYATSIIEIGPGDYVVTGSAYEIADNYNIRTVRLNDGPVVVWDKTYHGDQEDRATSVRLVSGGDLLIGGSTNSSISSGMWDGLLMPADIDLGDYATPVTFGGTEDEKSLDMREVHDLLGTPEGYLFVGYREYPLGEQRALAWKVNHGFVEDWSEEYRAGEGEGLPFEITVARSFTETDDHGYVLAGKAQIVLSEDPDAWVARVNNDGSLAWERLFDRGLADEANSVFAVSDGGYVVGGYTTEDTAEFGDYWFIKLDATGEVQWERIYSGAYQGPDSISSVRQTYDGGYIMAGTTQSVESRDCPRLIKLDRYAELITE